LGGHIYSTKSLLARIIVHDDLWIYNQRL
jgi:hypothetical protein